MEDFENTDEILGENEIDSFFTDCLEEFLQVKKDELNYLLSHKIQYSDTSKNSIFGELKEDLENVISDLKKLLSTIKTIDDISLSGDETINNVFEYLEEYADNFVISDEKNQRKKDYVKYHKIEELLFLFYDEDDPDSELYDDEGFDID